VDGIVAVRAGDRVAELARQRVVDGVELLRPVERDARDAAGLLVENNGCRHESLRSLIAVKPSGC